MSRLPALGPRGEGWFVLQLLLLAAIVAAGFLTGPDWSGPARLASAALGSLLIGAGLLIPLRAIAHLDQSISPLPRPTQEGSLVQHGLYRYVRHPIYVGVMASALGFGLLMASLAALLLGGLLVVLLDLKARREEVWLTQRYPDYAAYAARTRRFLPGLY
jgi:protein-S-isoprenylcysteine O-methyltransferase Ste14